MESCSGRCWPQPKWLNYLLVEDWKRYAFTKQVGSKCTLPHFPLSAKTYFDSISVANCCNVHLCSKNDLLIRLETMFPSPIKPALSLSVRNILWLMSIQFYKRSTWTWNVDCGIFGLCTLHLLLPNQNNYDIQLSQSLFVSVTECCHFHAAVQCFLNWHM